MSEKNTWADQTPRFVAEDAVDTINAELVRAGNLPLLACQVPTAVKVITQIAAGSYQAGRDIALAETEPDLPTFGGPFGTLLAAMDAMDAQRAQERAVLVKHIAILDGRGFE
jgi:hypothetical protein